MNGNERVEQFLDAYFSARSEFVLASVTDDFIWTNLALPRATCQGRLELAAKLAVPNLGLPLPLEAAHHETSLVVQSGDRLMHERVDYLTFASQTVSIPCAAAFDLRESRIAAWRDYYDIGIVLRFFAGLGHPLDTVDWW
jgi:limonene-1,2-epoxide hydrolase